MHDMVGADAPQAVGRARGDAPEHRADIDLGAQRRHRARNGVILRLQASTGVLQASVQAGALVGGPCELCSGASPREKYWGACRKLCKRTSTDAA